MTQAITLAFDTLTEYRDYAQNRPHNAWGKSSQRTDDYSFYGTGSFEDAVYLSRYGWPEGRRKMSDALKDMALISPHGRLASWQHDVAGFLPDVPRAIVGMPDCMFNAGGECRKTRPVLRIVTNLGRHANISSYTIQWHGAAILTWIDRLEACGISCELIACMYSSAFGASEPDAHVRVTLKNAGQPLDLDVLAFCLVNPAFHRRFKFACLENTPSLKGHSSGYGKSQELSEEEKEELGADIYIYKTSDDYKDMQHAFDNVSGFFKTQLAKHNIIIPE